MHKTTRALVLREVKYKEADKILTVLSEDEGKLTVKARGALRRSSRITAATQQLVFSEMTLFQNAGKWQLNEAATIEQFLPLRADLSKMALGCYFAELLEAVSDEDSPNPAVLQLGLNSLYALSEDLCPPEQIKAVFEMRLMCLSGFEPVLSGCVACGEEHDDIRFSARGGVLHCPGCPPGEPGQSLPLCEGSLAAPYRLRAREKDILLPFGGSGPAAAVRCLGGIPALSAGARLRLAGLLEICQIKGYG